MSLFDSSNYLILKQLFGFEPSPKQDVLLGKLVHFIHQNQERSLFILRGYAGTGKTTLIAALTRYFKQGSIPFRLMAPTGRAAKVLSTYSGSHASTIHRSIYFARTGTGGGMILRLQKNNLANSIIVVDEASMLTDQTSTEQGGGRNLLIDLVEFAFSAPGCKLILVGDTAQLPPVGSNHSPALDAHFLTNAFHLNITQFELDEVIRQEESSGILQNATQLRHLLAENTGVSLPLFDLYGQKDIIKLPNNEVLESLIASYDRWGFDDTIIITRSNKKANLYNREIRNRILFREGRINAGDYLMVVKNNYFWLEEGHEAGFLANGDLIELMAVQKTESMYGFDFANIRARLVDYPNAPEIEIKILLNALDLEGPSLSYEDNNKLYQEVMLDYADLPQKAARLQKVKENPYFNAIQVKYAYALTCHKTQGGQWHTVFVDQGFIGEDALDSNHLRWLYTAITRATKKVYLLSFPDEYFQ